MAAPIVRLIVFWVYIRVAPILGNYPIKQFDSVDAHLGIFMGMSQINDSDVKNQLLI